MKVTTGDLKAALDGGGKVALIDVRTPAEFGEVHIPGSISMPLGRVDRNALRAAAERGEQCVVICRSGKRAAQACGQLGETCGELGVLDGGLDAWLEAGNPVNRGAAAMSLERQVRIAAGVLVLLGVVLGTWAHPAFYGLAAFVGAGLTFAGLTDWCGMGMLLARMPWNQRAVSSEVCGKT